MNKGMNLLVFPVTDLSKAKKLFSTLLGVEPYADSPYYVGYRVGDQEIGLDPNGHKQGLIGPIPYWPVEDIKKSLQSLLDAGAEIRQGVTDIGGGGLIASVKDADGNIIALRQM